MKNDSALFFTCSLLEFIARRQKLKRGDAASAIGEKGLLRVYEYADVLHCEPIAAVADEVVTSCGVPEGDFDNVAACKYEVPDYWAIGEVFSRLVEDVLDFKAELCGKQGIIKTLLEVYSSGTAAAISNYNSDFFYQPRDYIAECYKAGKILDD